MMMMILGFVDYPVYSLYSHLMFTWNGIPHGIAIMSLSELLESNIIGSLSEASTTDVEAVFANQTMGVVAHTAASASFSKFIRMRSPSSLHHDSSGLQ